MKAAVLYEANTPLVIEDLDQEEPAQGEVLVKLGASGVCHSDWHVVKGEWTHHPLPTVLGHEGAGVVEATGPGVTNVRPGDHVILSWKASCGICETCQKGWPNLCYNPLESPTLQRRSDGATVSRLGHLGTFAAYATVPEVAAVPIDKDVPFAQAALVGCGVTTGVGAAINTAQVQPGTTVAVFGAGGVGLNCMQGAEIAGATTIIAVDILDNKLDMAMEFGATPRRQRLEGGPRRAHHRADRRPRSPLRLRGDRARRGAIRTEHPLHAQAGRHRVGRPRAGRDTGDH